MWKTILTYMNEFWGTIGEMSPYLLFGFFMAGILSVVVSKSFVQQHLGGRGLWPVIKASVLGIPLPLCSCSVIPVSMSLRKQGASREATLSFLLSTPQTGVDSILVTWSLLGPIFAVVRPVVALITGLFGGILTRLLTLHSVDNTEAADQNESHCCCSQNATQKTQSKLKAMLEHGFVTLPRDIGKSLLIGLLIAAFVTVIIPDGFFADHLGTGLPAMLAMMLMGIPLYICATGSVPIAAALILKGISPGAALVFLMTGPATNAATLATVWKTLGRSVALSYLITVAVCALASGLVLDALLGDQALNVVTASGAMLPSWLKHVSAVLLIGLIIGTHIKPDKSGKPTESTADTQHKPALASHH